MAEGAICRSLVIAVTLATGGSGSIAQTPPTPQRATPTYANVEYARQQNPLEPMATS